MKKYLKIFSIFVTLGCLCSFSSCEKAGTELADLMIIQGIGIDYDSGEYTVTVEILNNEQSGSPSGDSSSDNKTKIYSIKGTSISEALRLLTTKSGNLPLFAHNRVIVVNENLREKNISDIMEFFVRNYDSRATQLLCVSQNKTAEEIIRAKLLADTVKSEILENLLEESYMQSIVPRVRVIDAVNLLQNTAMTLYIPAVTVAKNGENEDYELTGCALYNKEGKVSAFLDTEQTKGLAFLNNTVKQGFLTGELKNGGKATFLISKSKTKYDVYTKNGRLCYRLTVDISCDVDEISVPERKISDEKILSDLKNCVKNTVSGRMYTTLEFLKGQSGGDCINYCKILELKKPGLYRSVINDWSSFFSSINTEITVNVTIRRIGEETLGD